MRLLLDTHLYLWWLQDDARLSSGARVRIIGASDVLISSASIWEVAIKASIGRLVADVEQIVQHITLSGFRELPVSARHAAAVVRLPRIHNDPFDHILVAQAMAEQVQLLTHDRALRKYSELVQVV